MDTYKALIAGVLLALTAIPSQAGADWLQRQRRSRYRLLLENEAYRVQVDSLRSALAAYREAAAAQDSLTQLLGLYEENENKVSAALAPEDYTLEARDSLLSVWYHQRQVSNIDEGNYDMDSVHFTSAVPDSVYIKKIAEMNSFIALPFNQTVRDYIILYTEKMPTKMAHILGLCDYYMPIFEETFSRYGLPDELKYMAIIESALNPRAVSRAGATGMWQFMYRSARSYGLRMNSYVDERMDPYKSADAAARYLRDSYRVFGDWNLAISSYNCGSGNVSKAIRRAGGKTDFWSIYPYLPRETRGYVPAMVGAMYAIRYRSEYGLRAEKIQFPASMDTLQIHKMLHFRQISDNIGIPVQELRDINPQYMHDVIPGSATEGFTLRLPFNYTGAFVEREDSIYTYMADSLFNPVTVSVIKSQAGSSSRIAYKVRSGDYLGKIAKKYHVTVSQLRRWNNLSSDRLRVGQVLYIHQ